MRVAIQDKTALRSLQPLETAAYLRANGWRVATDFPGKGALWIFHDESGVEFDVTLPARRELGDYALRMEELLSILAKVEQRSQLDVLRDIQMVSSDVIRVRAPGENTESGTLPFSKAVAFVEHSRDMMLAAACAAVRKRPVYAKRKAQQAMDYLSQIRMGQTEQGSFVLTILSPVAPELRPAQPDLLPKPPYERQVTTTLMESLAALSRAAGVAAVQEDMEPFRAAVDVGVSANLCDAVVGLSAASPKQGIEIRVTWSRTRSVESASAIGRVLLSGDSIPFIEEAARQFRAATPSEDVEIEGAVTRLARDERATEGEVTITGNVEGQIRSVRVMLGEKDYAQAGQAHEARRTVACTGDLVKEGHGYLLRHPRGFMIVREEDIS